MPSIEQGENLIFLPSFKLAKVLGLVVERNFVMDSVGLFL